MTKNRYGNVSDESDDSTDDEDSTLIDREDDMGSFANQKWKLKATRIIKFLSYPVVFIIVLAGTVISKGAILLMTSQLKKNETILHCNRELHRDKTFVVTVPDDEKTAWIWCIIIAYSIPEILTLIHSVMICVFKSPKLPNIKYSLLVVIMETFHVVGLAIMFIIVLPDLDSIQGAMLTSCVCFVPGLLGLLSRGKSNRIIFILVNVVALAVQATAFVLWPLINNSNSSLWFIPGALALVSCGWWENYVSIKSPLSLIKTLGRIKEEMSLSKNFIYIFVSLWKIAIFCISSALILHLRSDTEFWHLFKMFKYTFSHHNITIIEVQPIIGGDTIPDLSDILPNGLKVMMHTESNTLIYILVIQILSGYFAYIFGKFACKTLIQGFSYALPVNITIPVLMSFLITICNLRNEDPCFFHGIIPDYLFYKSPAFSVLSHFFITENTWIWLLWLLSQTWITLHICAPKCERPQSTDQLFMTPYYNGLLMDQSMALNRRREEQPLEGSKEQTKEKIHDEDESIIGEPTGSNIPKSDLVTKIYACATMWHESKGEMTECLKSILRLDRHHCARKNYQEFLKIDPDYYELETHIFFDDAFKKSEKSNNEVEVNEWVKDFVKLVGQTAFHETGIVVKPMKKYPTPYGGRLVWTLPGNTMMFVHLKDSSKIRKRKRWSQVMYMYYLLDHRINDLTISKKRKKIIAKNSFILALDGDVVFQPSAVKLLVDLMKKDTNLGAACGRIHPLGSGFIVWYQKFEYAIGHWLQKATEHTIGCVLCSPGCFSLFRANALMKPEVMKTYTTTSSEARHYVQYDQGEDRWLCTLLLKRGYKVEYSAASDAYTHAPESFYEFFKQRRRWLPSTMANVMDLLEDYKRVVKRNKNISQLYMLYQFLLMVGTILGPGTIFLMLVGACISTFKIGIWESFIYNIIPVLLFVAVCFMCESKIQLFMAAVISMAYGLVMMAVIVGILVQIVQDSWLSPSSIFLLLIICQFVITGIMHPQELECLPYGIIYFVTIPSMYLLLMIYSLANLNDVTWGTRTGDSDQNDQKAEEEKTNAEEAKSKKEQSSFFGFEKSDQGSIEFSLAGLFKCILCTHGKTYDEKNHFVGIENSLERLEKRFDAVERLIDPEKSSSQRRRTSFREPRNKQESTRQDSDSESSESDSVELRQQRAFLVNPYWLEDKDLQEGEVDFLTAWEEQFWLDTISKYLPPIYEDKKKEAKVAAELKELRDKMFSAFFMLNALFVTIIFLMQLNVDILHIEWPLNSQTIISYYQKFREVRIEKQYLHLEPIGLAFVAFFGIILVIQFTAMLFHRLSTFTQILANTSLEKWGYCWKKSKNPSGKAFLVEATEEIVEELERTAYNARFGQRSNSHRGTRESQTLNEVMRERIFSMSEGSGLPRHMSTRRSSQFHQALQRNESIVAHKRLSQTQANGTNNSDQMNTTNHVQALESITELYSGSVNHGFE